MAMNLLKKSLPAERKVCGYTIKKMPLGAYLTAVERIKGFPAGLMNALFPGMTLADMLDWLKGLDEARLTQLLGTVLTTVPAQGIELIADLTGIPAQQLLEDDSIGLSGLMQIVKAFTEVNELESFFAEIRSLIAKFKV